MWPACTSYVSLDVMTVSVGLEASGKLNLVLCLQVDYAPYMKPPFRLELIGTVDHPPQREDLPLYLSPIEAGFRSPVEDYLDRRLEVCL